MQGEQVAVPGDEGARQGRVVGDQAVVPGDRKHLGDTALVLGLDLAEDPVQIRGHEFLDILASHRHVGLHERHFDIGDEVGEEMPLAIHALHLLGEPGLGRRTESASDAEPPRDDLARLRPSEDPGDGTEALDAGCGVRPASRTRSQVHRSELRDRGRGGEVGRQIRVADECPVGIHGVARGDVHDLVPAGEVCRILP